MASLPFLSFNVHVILPASYCSAGALVLLYSATGQYSLDKRCLFCLRECGVFGGEDRVRGV